MSQVAVSTMNWENDLMGQPQQVEPGQLNKVLKDLMLGGTTDLIVTESAGFVRIFYTTYADDLKHGLARWHTASGQDLQQAWANSAPLPELGTGVQLNGVEYMAYSHPSVGPYFIEIGPLWYYVKGGLVNYSKL